jgi:hypothetical protein
MIRSFVVGNGAIDAHARRSTTCGIGRDRDPGRCGPVFARG